MMISAYTQKVALTPASRLAATTSRIFSSDARSTIIPKGWKDDVTSSSYHNKVGIPDKATIASSSVNNYVSPMVMAETTSHMNGTHVPSLASSSSNSFFRSRGDSDSHHYTSKEDNSSAKESKGQDTPQDVASSTSQIPPVALHTTMPPQKETQVDQTQRSAFKEQAVPSTPFARILGFGK